MTSPRLRLRRALAAPLFAALLASGASAQEMDFDAMSDAERAAFGAEVRAYLLENPEVIMEAVQALEARQAQAQAQADLDLVAENAEAIFDDGYSWVGGNPEGDVTVVEFLDYRCGYCRRAHPDVLELIESDGNIRFVIKEFPILGENSVRSSRFALAARAVGGDEAYEAASEALMTLNADMDETVMRRLAESLGLDADAVLAEMDSPAIDEQIARTRDLAQMLQVNGTPTFVMGDELIRGYIPLEAMQEIIAETRQEG